MSDTKQSGLVGWAVFAGVLLIISGVFDAIYGLAALIGPSAAYFATGTGSLWMIDVTGWGWWHLILGALMVLSGVFLLRGASWARIVAIILVAVNAFSQFASISYQPWWSLTIIALDVLIIYAVIVHGKELKDVA